MSKNRLPLPKDKQEKDRLLHFLYYNIAAETESDLYATVSSMYKIAATTYRRYKDGQRWESRKFERRATYHNLERPQTNDEIVENICEGVALGKTIKSMCDQNGISDDTFVKWRKDNPMYMKRYLQALREFDKGFKEKAIPKAKMVLLDDLEEREVKETKTFYKIGKEGNKIEKVIITQSTHPANAQTAKYLIDTYEQKEIDNQKQESSTSLQAMSEEELHDLIYDYLNKDWYDQIPD